MRMNSSLPTKLPSFSDAHVLVIGDVMLDRYWFGGTERISPEAPVPVVKVDNENHRPGGAGNVALNIGALGTKITLLGITGKDEAADQLATQLNAAGIQHHLHRAHASNTIIKLRVLSQHQQLIRLDFESDLHPVEKAPLLAEFKNQLTQTQLVVLSDYQKGTLSDPQALIRLAKQANVPVLVDPKGNDFSIYQGADILTPNLKEFEAIVGKSTSEQEFIAKGRDLIDELDLKALLVTRGEQGMTLIETDSTHHVPAFAREVYDVTGAGDTVIGVLSAAIAAGSTLAAAVSLANLAASIAVGKLGAATVSTPELEIGLDNHQAVNTGIVNDEQLAQAVALARSQNKKIVFTNGCYDIIHAGHVMSLKMAKQCGDLLIVAVNSDESIREIKGPDRPINNLEHRMTVLANLGMVDWVVPFSDKTPERLLELIRPDILAKGGDYTLNQVVGADIVKNYGGEVRIMKHGITTTSTSILNQLTAEEA